MALVSVMIYGLAVISNFKRSTSRPYTGSSGILPQTGQSSLAYAVASKERLNFKVMLLLQLNRGFIMVPIKRLGLVMDIVWQLDPWEKYF